uniref:Uncharacterized protein n=1 Tax=viral metagenome TaxID=1070528 RepID=A0A6C0ADW8_9ZZZZ
MGVILSKNAKIDNIINILLYKDLNGCIFEKYIDIFLFYISKPPLSSKEKTFKYFLIHKPVCGDIELCVQNNNEAPINIYKIDYYLKDKVYRNNSTFFLNINLNEKIDYSKFIKLIKKKNRTFENLSEITECDSNTLKKKLNEVRNANISDIEKMFEIKSIKKKIDILTYLESLDHLEEAFSKMREKSIIIPDSSAPEEDNFIILEIVNSKVSAPQEKIFIIPEAVKIFNH